MTDYTKDTGSSGEMMIRDTGTVIEFWLNSHNSSTFNNQLPWGYTVNGVTDNSNEKKYSAGAGWVKFGAWTVSTSQTVTFRIFDTGTSGFGGPTSFSQAISRAKVPNAPSTPTVTGYGSTYVNLSWTDGASNGAPITARQVAYNTVNTTSSASSIRSDTHTYATVGGLTPGRTYYFWVRTFNSVGWGPWSPVRSATTLQVPSPPNQPVLSNATQTTFVISFTDNDPGGSPITARQYGISLINDGNTATWNYYGGVGEVGSLSPASTYYVWARVGNAVGWSGLSPVASIRTIAGARVKVGDVWKEAVPYVKDGGVWKLARPWGRNAGTWNETT